ncbi:hypothetical protein CGLAR1_01905 [Corynebacterium glutamicum]|uniref:DNA adenine methylase n=1 Tax=Corynebacterium glutamicum TaxID=1718 RepID=UPI0004F86B66|nr:DNA adenine methylase [Corynebacterium glutamicum]AIK84045.1 hypothetical protein CGLAR1_01905 [Corynebacterium glutamicum]AIK86807.1 hypothetical protein AR0_01900 [Corynebacterium glutamicum]
MNEQTVIQVLTSAFPKPSQPQPFPLQGSKRGQSPIINALIPEAQPRWIEPFCGSAAASIGARKAGRVGDVIISDINKDLIHLWQAILDDPTGLVDEYEKVWRSQFNDAGIVDDPRGYFNTVRARFNESEVKEPADFLFILNRIVKAALRYGPNGVNQSADGRRLGAKPETVRQRIYGTAELMAGTKARHADWLTVLAEAGADDIIYMDPPYQGTSNSLDHRYKAGLSVDVFEAGVREGVSRDLSMIISYDAIAGPVTYGRALAPDLDLLTLDVLTGVSAQGTLLGRKQPSHEALYLSPALVKRLGGRDAVANRVDAHSLQIAV